MQSNPKAPSARHCRLVNKLAVYAAGGVSLATAEASAGIVHTDLGPIGVEVVHGFVDLDLNHDRKGDFQLVHEVTHFEIRAGCTGTTYRTGICNTSGSVTDEVAFIRGVDANGVVANDAGHALNIPSGTVISAATRPQALLAEFRAKWSSFSSGATSRYAFKVGNFAAWWQPRGFVGLWFDIPGGGRHAAWADVGATGDQFSVNSALLFGFAYETIPGKPILAGAVPEPPSLVLLAAGAAGLGMLRRKRNSTKSASAPSGR